MRWLSLAFVVIMVAGCKAEVDSKEAEDFLSSELERWIGETPTTVQCHGPVRRKQSAGIKCKASFRQTGAASADIRLVQTNGRGALAIASVQGLVFAADLEGQVATRFSIRLKTNLKLDCGERVRLPVAGGEFFCLAKNANGESTRLLVTMTSDQGKVKFGTEFTPVPEAPVVP